MIVVYDSALETRKTYFPSADRRLRESPDDATSPSHDMHKKINNHQIW